ncbi:hypothetical protein C2W62_10100 [Candidatus Entotheonella serta]|nr:hypothetical protein C2W62_10100 [Candidatus Entotheonella serta]
MLGILRPWLLWSLILTCLLGPLAAPVHATELDSEPHLALMIGALWPGETTIHHDLSSMYEILRHRGFATEEILLMQGLLTRRAILILLHDAHQRIRSWRQGEVFVYVSGHGFYRGTSAANAIPYLLLRQTGTPSSEEEVGWKEMLDTLAVPPTVRLTILPDA